MPPLRPFPLPNLSIGTDIVHIPRILAIIDPSRSQNSSKNLASFLRRTLTAREKPHYHARNSRDLRSLENPESLRRLATYLAGRWAAKEAVVKAWRWRRLTLDQIQILQGESGRVFGIVLDRRAGEVGSEDGDVQEEAGQVVRVSISHDTEYATAVCIAASEDGMEGDVGGEAAARDVS